MKSTHRILISLGLPLLVAAAACGTDATADDAIPRKTQKPTRAIEVVANDFGFALSGGSRVATGFVPVTIENDGAEDHQVVVARLDDGVTIADFVDASHEGTADALVTYVGGANAVAANARTRGWAELQPGRHILICFIPSADGVAHLHKGMVAEFTVVSDGEPVAPPEDVTGEVVLSDFGITPPAAGFTESGTYRFVNRGAEPHEMILLKLDSGKTLADAAAYRANGSKGAAPYTFVGGAGVIAPGATGYADLVLDPGQYIAVCVVESEQHDKAHADLGMVAVFSIG